MAIKSINVEGIGPVTFQKRRGSRSVRIHVNGSIVKVTMPYYAPYSLAENFVKSRIKWINEHRKPTQLLVEGTYVGKQHVISVNQGDNLRTAIKHDALVVTLPRTSSIEDPAVQKRLQSAAERVLKLEAEKFITPRLSDLALEHGFQYKTVRYKKMKSRWGSCDSNSNLTFNIYLVQLPWGLIDYVIIHELAHTMEHNHSNEFWQIVKNCIPDYKERRKVLKQHHSDIISS